jgi:hypothetical protein
MPSQRNEGDIMHGISTARFAAVTALLALQTPAAAWAADAAQPETAMCLQVNDIRSANARTETAIEYRMADGKVWVSQLPRRCPGLGIFPYTEVLHLDQICSNQTQIHIRQTGAACTLGPFMLQSAGGN